MSKVAPALNIKPEALPESLRELVRVLGSAEALRLVGQYGGARLPGLMRMKEGHAFRVFMGEASFAKLLAHYGQEQLDLPKFDAYLRELRHDQVRWCREQGLTVDETAEATGYSRRHVMNIIGGHADSADPFTLALFEEEAAAREPVAREPAPREAPSQTVAAHNPFGLGQVR